MSATTTERTALLRAAKNFMLLGTPVQRGDVINVSGLTAHKRAQLERLGYGTLIEQYDPEADGDVIEPANAAARTAMDADVLPTPPEPVAETTVEPVAVDSDPFTEVEQGDNEAVPQPDDSDTLACDACAFVAKSPSGLASHRRAKHAR